MRVLPTLIVLRSCLKPPGHRFEVSDSSEVRFRERHANHILHGAEGEDTFGGVRYLSSSAGHPFRASLPFEKYIAEGLALSEEEKKPN